MPSFAIEVPGEANPLTEDILIRTLQSASSSDPAQIQVGTKQLQQWEKSSGYYRQLQSAYLDRRLPLEIRYLAVIQLKNGIDKYWRKTALNAVSKEDKDIIRSRLVESILNEQDHRLALQNALVIAKIARYEFPNDWPDAILAFVEAIRAPNTSSLQAARALLALLHIVKELSTGRLQRTRQYLQAATPEIVAVVGNVYMQLVERWRPAPNVEDMQQSLLAIKLLRRLLVSGYEHPNRDSTVTSFWGLTLDHLGSFVPAVKTPSTSLPNAVSTLLGRHTLQLAKLHHEMARNHPAAYVLLPNAVDLTRSYWNLVKDFGDVFGSKEAVVSALSSSNIGTDGDSNDKSFVEKIALKGLLIVRASVKMVHNPAQTFKYRSPEDKEEKKRATDIVRHDLLSEQFIRDAMEILVTRFFVFRASDLREWLEEPEEWEKREEGDGEDWEFSVRSCSEKLFLDLAINYKDVIVQPLLSVFNSVANPENEDVLFKDSVYTAIGLSAAVIHEQLDFDAFLRNTLIAEVQKSNPGFNILRRRAAVLLGQWVTVKISQESRPLVYQVFQHLLNHEDPLNDQVVRVTAGRQFQNIANDWDFQADQFLPYGQTILTQLMQLIEEVELIDTKMALLNTISTIVERLDFHITPFAERIVNLLPALWDQAADEHLMKQAILTILARLVNAMRADSVPLHSMVFPIVKGAVEPGSETQVYLLEDALDLWGAVLAQTPSDSASPDHLSLVQYLFPIYELGSESLRKALEITESYVMLAPSHMLSDGVRTQLFTSLAELLGNLRPDANGLVCNLIELIIRSAQRLGAEAAVTQTASDLVQTGFLRQLLVALRGSWAAHCTTGPLAKDPPVDGIVETDYFAILACLILGSVPAFCHAVQTCAPALLAAADGTHQSPDLGATMTWLLEEWFSHFENIGDPMRRKLMCLALTKLLETEQPFILLSLQSLMTVWTDVVTELREGAADASGDSLVYGTQDAPEGPEAPEDARRRTLTLEDDVHTVNLPRFVQHHLQQAVAAAGGEQRFQEQWLVNVDADVVQAFSALGTL